MTEPTRSPDPESASPSRLRRWLLDAPPLLLLGVAAAIGVAGFGTRRAIATAAAERQAAESRLDSARREAAAAGDSLAAVRAVSAGPAGDTAFIVVSIAENRLWYKRRDSVLFTTRVATGTGGELKKTAGSKATWKFDTPRGRLKVERKDEAPMWVPPDWHFVELAKKKKLSLVFLKGAMTVPVGDGSVIALSGQDVVRRMPDGREIPYDAREGREIIVGRKLIVPPLGTHQRRFAGVLGAFRLYLGDGYGIHGTDVPSSIGRSASHGCIRVRNEDIEVLYQLVSVGTPVLVY